MGSVSKFLTLLVVLSFLHAAVVCGSCAVKRIGSGPEAAPSMTCLDVCGKGAPSGLVQGFDLPFTVSTVVEIHIPESLNNPPTPDKAVASADSGEVYKPPKS